MRFALGPSHPKSKAPDTPQTSNATTPSRTGAARFAAAEGVCPCKDQLCENQLLPSGELTVCYGKSPFLMGKSTISMAIFHCYVSSPEAILLNYRIQLRHCQSQTIKGKSWRDGIADGSKNSTTGSIPGLIAA